MIFSYYGNILLILNVEVCIIFKERVILFLEFRKLRYIVRLSIFIAS